MFLMPALISMSVTATRLYTSLADFSSSADMYEGLFLRYFPRSMGPIFCSVKVSNLGRGHRVVSNAKRVPIVHVSYEQFSTPQIATLSLEMSGQPCDKPQGPNFENTLESGVRK